MKLYGMQQSRSFRCLWALEESGLEYEYVPIKLRTEAEVPDSAQNPSYLAINIQELLKLSDRIAVIYKGKLSKIMPSEEVTPEKLGVLMGGGSID